MAGFDVKTLVLVSAIVSLTVAVTFGVATLNLQDRNRAMVFWAAGFFLRALGFLGISFRDRLPDLITQPLANTLLFAGSVLLFLGILAFSERRLPGLPMAVWIGACFVFLILVGYDNSTYNLKVLVVSLFLLAIDVAISITLLWQGDRRLFLQRLIVAAFFLLDAGLQAGRSALAILLAPQRGLFDVTILSLAGFLETFIMPICVEIALLTMVARRTQAEREQVIVELEEALRKVDTLRGLLPICSECKRIRDEAGTWHAVEIFIQAHSNADFTHGICPECQARLYPGYKP